ncbi:disease resistance protein RUN1 isoform X2 [Cryptomeria japonica]|uniref:disease resistance protein RUN1 isoform X2 n=1 Tax=Cryptomeria japonica TaxID=3369 RepID=UPI0027DAB17E|nr:disease resistance protein RUN1 isoform X2 [Cryptomeria japonica]
MATYTPTSPIQIVNTFDEIVPSSAASSSASPLLRPASFDVFINHCGVDVKYTLATTISHKLTALGISVFLDAHSLQLGDVIPAQIQEAIRTATLHIAIFSVNYANSPWCLAELSSMLKTGNRVIPVFYHVDPSDLRWMGKEKGIYAPAFSQYQLKGRYSKEKLDEWKMALEDASLRSGCVIKDSRDEAMQLKNIVNMVSKELGKVPFLVADKPVGLVDIVRDFEEVVESGPNAQIVGIVGMGGAGKTTLAKELYNRKSPSFKYCSFVFAVRDAASKNALHEKQKMLLKELGVQDVAFDNIERGKAILANRLRSVPALIVLDDVDHGSQLDALLPTKDGLASDSLVIVTSRELNLLAKWGAAIYRIKALNPLHAKELFCWHAFLQSHSQEGFEKIVEKFLQACDGLPLSIAVFGGLVYGKSKDYWESQLDKIFRILPGDVKERLNVSYDSLDEEEKEMFMDVACFFIGRKKSWAIEVWDESRWSGLHGWETLVNKCLVNVDENDIIIMHDHLRDLGRELAGRHPSSRVWHQEQIIDIQKQIKGGMSIRGIDAARFEYTDEPLRQRSACFELIGSLSNRCFGIPPPSSLGLKFFSGREEQFIKYFGTPLEGPVCLRLDEFKGRKIQSWSLRNLRILELIKAHCLVQLWDNSDPPLQLRELCIDEASVLQRIPNSIGRLQGLKCINISVCEALEDLPEEFCNLQSLEWLKLSDCSRLSSLPSHLGDLINLRHLHLMKCKKLQTLPDSFKQLRHLQHLNLQGCRQLTLRSDMLESIGNLEYLNFGGCRKLEQLPNKITHQVRLRELKATYTSIREVPSDIGELRKLEVLEIGSRFLASLPYSLGNLSSLTRLELRNCEMLNCLPDFSGPLNMLKRISIEYTSVSTISISGDSCPSLEYIDLRGNDHLVDIQSLPTSVRRLQVLDCKTLKKATGLGGLANLQLLSIVRCPELNELPSFADFHSLKEIQIRDCDEIVEIEGLEKSRSLETLEVVQTSWKSQGIQSLEGLEKLKRLVMAAENRSALRPCIQTIKKWPGEMVICGRAVSGAESALDSLSFPTLSIVRSLERSSILNNWNEWKVECRKMHASDAAVVCLLVNSITNCTCWLSFSGWTTMPLKEGKWVLVGVLRQGCGDIVSATAEILAGEGGGEVERGILLVGEEGIVLETFTRLWTLFI